MPPGRACSSISFAPKGVDAWYDAHVGAGEDWRIATAKALEASQIFVLLFSENVAQSSDMAKELAAAVLEKKLIVPVRLQNIAPKGAFLYELASRNWINAYEDTEARLADVAKGLAQLVRSGVKDESALPFEREGSRQEARRKWPLIAGAAAVLLATASALAAWLFWPQARWSVEKSRSFIASLALEDYPAFSSDGSMLAYTSGPEGGARQIFVRSLSGGEGIKITNDSYDDFAPTWSSDGAHIAYVGLKPGEPCHIMVVTVPAGGAREAGRCTHGEAKSIAWQPGTSFLYVAEYGVGKLRGAIVYRIDLDSGSPPARGRKAGHAGHHRGPALLAGWKMADLYAGRAADHAARTVQRTRENAGLCVPGHGLERHARLGGGFRHGPGGGLPGVVGGSEITAFPLSGKDRYSVYTTPTRVGNFAVGGGLLALQTDISRTSLARAGNAANTPPDIIDAAGGLTWSLDFSIGRHTIFFLSNRSGTNAIWQDESQEPRLRWCSMSGSPSSNASASHPMARCWPFRAKHRKARRCG